MLEVSEERLREIIAEWQPTNADYVAFCHEVLTRLDSLEKEVNRLVKEVKQSRK